MLAIDTRAGTLFEALSLVSRAAASRDLIPALTGVLFEGTGTSLSLTATDLEFGLRTKIPVSITSEGKALLPAKALLELLRRVPPADGVSFKIIEGRAAIRFRKSRFDIPTFPVEDFPQISFESEGPSVILQTAALREALGRVAYAAAQREDSLPVLLGIKLTFHGDGSVECCASDNFRLAWSRVTADTKREQHEVVVRGRALSELVRLLDEEEVRLVIGERQLSFASGRMEAFTALVEGQFPDHTKLVRSSYQTTVRFAVEDLLLAAERASLVADPKSPQIVLKAGEEGLSVSSGSVDSGSSFEEVEGEVEGEPLEITFNPKFLTDALKNADLERAEIGFNGPLSAARMKPVDRDDLLALLLPIRRM